MKKLDLVLAEKQKENAEPRLPETQSLKSSGKKSWENREENPAFTHAMKEVNGKTGEALQNAIEALKDDAVMKVLLGNVADPNTRINAVVTDKKLASNEVKAY